MIITKSESDKLSAKKQIIFWIFLFSNICLIKSVSNGAVVMEFSWRVARACGSTPRPWPSFHTGSGEETKYVRAG